MPVRRAPNLFIVGAPKSGTTSMYEYLRGHPGVFLPDFKEPCYYAADLAFDRSGNFLRYPADEALYFDLFRTAGEARIVGEGSTRYLYSKDAPRLICEASPDARIVAMLRNPVDMILSLHAHKLAAGTEDISDFDAALGAEEDRRHGRRLPPQSNPKLATYRDRALFGQQVSHWMDTFGRDRLHVIIFEDMVRAPEAEFRRLLEFLAIDPDYRPPSFAAYNIAHAARTPLLRRVLNSRPAQWFGWSLLPRVLGDRWTRALVRRFRESRFHRRPIARGPISSELRHRLEDEFAPDVAILSRLLERDMAAVWFNSHVLSEPQRPERTLLAGTSTLEGA